MQNAHGLAQTQQDKDHSFAIKECRTTEIVTTPTEWERRLQTSMHKISVHNPCSINGSNKFPYSVSL